MERKTPRELVDILISPKYVVKIGLWLYPLNKLGQESDEAALLGIDSLNIQKMLIESLPQGTAYLGLSQDKILNIFEQISSRKDLSSCVLVYNIDLLLSYLSFPDRQNLWDILYNGFPHRHKAILIAVPATAIHLLPVENKLYKWSLDDRLA